MMRGLRDGGDTYFVRQYEAVDPLRAMLLIRVSGIQQYSLLAPQSRFGDKLLRAGLIEGEINGKKNEMKKRKTELKST